MGQKEIFDVAVVKYGAFHPVDALRVGGEAVESA